MQKTDKKISCVGYARVSTEEQAKGQSCDTQFYYLRQWAKENEWNYIKDYADKGISGGKSQKERPALNQILTDLRKKKFEATLFLGTDRLSRDADLAFSIMRKIFKKNMCVGFLSLANYGLISDLEDPTLNLLLRQLTSNDEYVRKNIQWKTKQAMAKYKLEGKHMGKPPSFFKVDKKTGKLKVDNLVIYEIYELAKTRKQGSKRPYRFFSSISKQFGVPYFQVRRAINNQQKYSEDI